MVDVETPTHWDDALQLRITAELPDVSEEDVEVAVSGDVLTIMGKQRVEHEQSGDRGRFRSFSRSVRLPCEVKECDIDATFDKGVLTIRVHKLAEWQKALRRIEVKRD
jgi:HSP20 family protein